MIKNLKYFGLGFLVLAGCALLGGGHVNTTIKAPTNRADYAKHSVMITSPDGHSGGTGVIFRSGPSYSMILTNKHVCNLIQTGGKVITDDGAEYPVADYRPYAKHDLCAVGVNKDLHVQTKLAEQAPAIYSTSIVVGHPALFPSIITVGHFSQERTISIVYGIIPCDGTENGDDAMACVFFGGKPLIKSFLAQVVSSTIMPGSSGSGVFNSHGELSGLVFAGSQGLSYGFIVPWEYVRDFVRHMEKYPAQTPDPKKKDTNLFTASLLKKFCEKLAGRYTSICGNEIQYDGTN